MTPSFPLHLYCMLLQYAKELPVLKASHRKKKKSHKLSITPMWKEALLPPVHVLFLFIYLVGNAFWFLIAS